MVRIIFLLIFPLSVFAGDSLNAKYIETLSKSSTLEEERNTILRVSDSLRKAGNNKERFSFLNRLSRHYEEKGNSYLQAFSLNLLGSMYNAAGKYQEAVNTFKQAEQLFLKDKTAKEDEVHTGVANVYMNIGNSFFYLDDDDRSLFYYRKALMELKKKKNFETKDQERMALVYNNLGIGYSNKEDMETGIYYFRQALALDVKLGDSLRLANVICNLAAAESKAGRPDSALKLLFSVKAFYDRSGNPEDKAYMNREIAERYFKRGDIFLAREYALKAMNDIDTNYYSQLLLQTFELLYQISHQSGDLKGELFYYRKYNAVKDSSRQDEVLHTIQNQEMQMEFEKVRLTDSLMAANTIRNRDLKIEQERRQSYYLIGILLLTVLGLGVIYNRFKVTNRQKKIIEEQKMEVDTKNREIIESISYAKRLQEAILPSDAAMKAVFREHFVFYKPKDIVAGDFYWLHTVGGSPLRPDITLLAAADCTGHGVPGAMMSIACNNALNRTIDELKVSNTGEVLDTVKKLIVENFNRNESTIRDGMDISLLAISRRANTVEWSGANNRLLYLHKGELKEVRADKQALGISEKNEPFTTHVLPITEGDIFYLFTDGYADQFGGERNKKMGMKKLRELIETHMGKPLQEQAEAFALAFSEWKGPNEQVDDVTLIAVKI